MSVKQKRQFLMEFINWARDCGHDVFYIFEFPDEAIEEFENYMNNR